MVTVADEVGVLTDFERHHCIAITAGTRLAFAWNADLLPCDHAFW